MGQILHLGVGNFFRAHQAWYTQFCPGWSVTGVSFRTSSVRDGLAAQGYRYTLVIKGTDGTRTQDINCLRDMLVATEDPAAVVNRIAASDTDIITLTVTEKGYCLDRAGVLDLTHPDIAADLRGEALSAIGALARGLARRQEPVTVLSCDNLPENGRKLEAAVQRFAEAAGLTTHATVAFPACMVDRITPATTDAVRAEAADPMAVPTEAFSEWVIENRFANARPDWPGVQWVDDVASHEMRKLRMLNGAHSYLAYAGLTRGHDYVHEAVADPVLRAGATALMGEAAETLPRDLRDRAAEYAAALLHRFDNPNLHHRLDQIAMDGSEKMPIRIVAALGDRGSAASPALAAAVDAWVRFARAEVTAGRAVRDPKSDQIAAACNATDPDAALRAIIMPG